MLIDKENKYRFTEKGHKHELLVDNTWKSLTGVTTILNVLNKPKLMQWAVDKAMCQVGWSKKDEWERIGESFRKVATPRNLRIEGVTKGLEEIAKMSPEEFLDLLDVIRVAHAQNRNEAAKYGKRVHAEVERLILEAIAGNGGYIIEQDNDEKSVQHFINWSLENRVKFLGTEVHVYSEKLFLGGILDIICEIDGQLWLSDIKTSGSGIYPENFAQMGGYDLMVTEMKLYGKITGYIVLNLRKDGGFLEKRSVSNKNNIKFFLACLEIYRQQQRIKSNTL